MITEAMLMMHENGRRHSDDYENLRALNRMEGSTYGIKRYYTIPPFACSEEENPREISVTERLFPC